MNKKVLVISYLALMDATPNGRTMKSLLQGIPSEDLSLFCCLGTPDKGSCASAYKVTNKDALRSLLFSSKVGRVIDTTQEVAVKIPSDEVRKGDKRAWKYLAKELTWCFGRWKNKKFRQWVKEQNPDCIVYMYGDNIGLQRLATSLSRELSIPLVVYSCEDYCFKDYNYIDKKKYSPFFPIFRSMLLRATKKLFAQASGLITNSDALGADYTAAYGIQNVSTVMMASQMACIDNRAVKPMEEIHVDFLGALGHYRIDALVDIGNALQEIDSRLKLHVYGRVADGPLREKLESCPGIEYKGFVSYEKVQEVMRSSALLIEAINDTPYVRKSKKYGFSTKYADCFACGTPFLVYVPEDVIEARFALEHDCAFVATEKGQLVQVLRKALFDADARGHQLDMARAVTERFFDKDANIEKVAQMLREL